MLTSPAEGVRKRRTNERIREQSTRTKSGKVFTIEHDFLRNLGPSSIMRMRSLPRLFSQSSLSLFSRNPLPPRLRPPRSCLFVKFINRLQRPRVSLISRYVNQSIIIAKGSLVKNVKDKSNPTTTYSPAKRRTMDASKKE